MSQANPTEVQTNTYAENYVLYGDQTRAWRAAFPDSKAKAEVIHISASKLHAIPKVQLRIKELQTLSQEVSEKEFTVTVSELKEMLVTAAKGGLKSKVDAQENKVLHNIAGAVSAIAEINRMDGNHKETKLKLEHTGKDDGPIEVSSDADLARKIAFMLTKGVNSSA